MNCALLVASFGICFPSGDELPPANELEKRAVDHRRALLSGHVIFTGSFHSIAENRKRDVRYEIWYDADHYRVDVLDDDGEGKMKEIYGENCERPNHYVWYAEKNLGTDIIPLLLSVMGPGERIGGYLKVDPRLLGMNNVPHYVVQNVPLTTYLMRTDRDKSVVSKVVYGKNPAWQVKYVLNFGVSPLITMTFAPDFGGSLVRIETDGTIHGVKHIDRTELVPKKYGKDWFVESVVYEKTVGGKITQRDKWTVEAAEFNKPIPGRVFKMVDMGIPGGIKIHISHPDARGRHFWDGTRIVPFQQDMSLRYPDAPPGDTELQRQGVRAAQSA
jgi:hypothetical protein